MCLEIFFLRGTARLSSLTANGYLAAHGARRVGGGKGMWERVGREQKLHKVRAAFRRS